MPSTAYVLLDTLVISVDFFARSFIAQTTNFLFQNLLIALLFQLADTCWNGLNMRSKRVSVRLYVNCSVQAKVLTTSLALYVKLNIGPAIIYPRMIALKTLRPDRPRKVGIVKRQMHLTSNWQNDDFDAKYSLTHDTILLNYLRV